MYLGYSERQALLVRNSGNRKEYKFLYPIESSGPLLELAPLSAE